MGEHPDVESRIEERPSKCQLHGVLVSVFEKGVLLRGESGIGKSECALDLVSRGHRLVADDAVEVLALDGKLTGRASCSTRFLLEIHGLGITNVRELYGDGAVREETPVDLCIDLTEDPAHNPLQAAGDTAEICGVRVAKIVLPVAPGRNLALLVETAVRLHRRGTADRMRATEELLEEHARLLDPGR